MRAAPVLAAAALLGVPALAAARDVDVPFTAHGSIVITWQGDPARGCAAAGVCGVAGSLTWRTAGGDVYGFAGANGFFLEDLTFGGAAPAVVRVRRTSDGADVTTCADTAPGSSSFDSPPGIRFSSGRCAGPTVEDLAALSPSKAFPARPDLRPGATIDLSRTQDLTAGPFVVHSVSTLRLTVEHAEDSGDSSGSNIKVGSAPPIRRTRRAELTLRYRVVALSGDLATTWTGLPTPGCAPFDACGVTGSVRDALTARGGAVRIRAVGPLHGRPTVRRELADLRRGRLHVSGVGVLTGARAAVSARLAWAGGPACVDSSTTTLPPLVMSSAALELGHRDYEDDSELLRSRCPGPFAADVWPDGTVIRGALSRRALGRRRLEVALDSPVHRIGFPGSTATVTGSATLTLQLATASARRITVETGG